MSKLKIQGGLPGIPASVPTTDSQTEEVSVANEDSSSGSAQREAKQAVDVAKSRLAEKQSIAQYNTPGQSAQFNPKEISIDRSLLKKSPASSDLTNEVDTTSKNDRGILYNGHAGLGGNSIIDRDLDQPDMAATKYQHNQTDLEFLDSKDPEKGGS